MFLSTVIWDAAGFSLFLNDKNELMRKESKSNGIWLYKAAMDFKDWKTNYHKKLVVTVPKSKLCALVCPPHFTLNTDDSTWNWLLIYLFAMICVNQIQSCDYMLIWCWLRNMHNYCHLTVFLLQGGMTGSRPWPYSLCQCARKTGWERHFIFPTLLILSFSLSLSLSSLWSGLLYNTYCIY